MRATLVLLASLALTGCFEDSQRLFADTRGDRIFVDGARQFCSFPEIAEPKCGMLGTEYDSETGKTRLSFEGETDQLSLHWIGEGIFIVPVANDVGAVRLAFGRWREGSARVAIIACDDLLSDNSPNLSNFDRSDFFGACSPRTRNAFSSLIPQIRQRIMMAEGENLAAIISPMPQK